MPSVGLFVGNAVVGARVGGLDGEVDGGLVGGLVGEIDGALVGEVDGELDGGLVGELDGGLDGEGVGGGTVTCKFPVGGSRQNEPPLLKTVSGTTSKRTTSSELIPKSVVSIDAKATTILSGFTSRDDPAVKTKDHSEHCTSSAFAV